MRLTPLLLLQMLQIFVLLDVYFALLSILLLLIVLVVVLILLLRRVLLLLLFLVVLPIDTVSLTNEQMTRAMARRWTARAVMAANRWTELPTSWPPPWGVGPVGA